jgi:hypothetical protein
MIDSISFLSCRARSPSGPWRLVMLVHVVSLRHALGVSRARANAPA